MRREVAVLCLAASLAAHASPAHAQNTLIVEGGASHALPPPGVGGEPATYGVGGLRVDWSAERGSLAGAVYGGHAADENGSDFVSGALEGTLWYGAGLVAVGVGGSVQAFAVQEPLLYRLTGGELSPMVRIGGSRAALVLRGRFGDGSSRLELHRADGTVRRATHELSTRGGEAELELTGAAVALTATLGGHRSGAGDFGVAGLHLTAAPGAMTIRLDGELWDTPVGGQAAGGLSVAVPAGRWEARASVARTSPDPLTLVEPATQSGVVIGLRLASFGMPAAVARTGVHEVLRAGDPARVRIRVVRPDAASVEVMGDFNDWSPVPLARAGEAWSVELDVAPGTHHFGFLVDGAWWIPEDVQGTVPDEWGRMNATMVVSDEESP